MTMSTSNQMVKPYQGDPQMGHLSTPISDSAFTRAFIGNLPAYRPGLSPLLRGLEIGMAHGYFIGGPWVMLGTQRGTEFANLNGLICGGTLLLIATACLAAYGLVSFQDQSSNNQDSLQSSKGWSEFTAGFFVGGMGSAFLAFFLLDNFEAVDAILRGFVN
ncbi:photosystem I reaction center protein subunit XI [Spirulina major]|uniref:photosystem I reaction center protein subunit XI n=1 Tax=Spirulina major TaxID=270636 RepID=UPI0009332A90|nr:photosystem I reaction center protein subunit XI [Spirulina major]